MDRNTLRVQLTRHEGRRTKPYLDTVGKLTWGVGRNLDDVPFSPDELLLVNQLIDLMLENDITRAVSAAEKYSWYSRLNDARQNVIVNMIFNLGPDKFAQFHNFQSHLSGEEWALAESDMEHSRWHGQVKERAVELESQLLNG